MAIIHVAYTFDPVHFLEIFQEKVIINGHVQHDRLLAWASEIAAAQSPERRVLLEMIRFDPEVLSASQDGAFYSRELFMVALAESLLPAPSLSSRQRESYYVLQVVLPELGWEAKSINRLIRGDSLDTLLQSSLFPALAGEFKELRQYGGWLDHAAITGFQKQMQEMANVFLCPKDDLISLLSGTAQLLAIPPPSLLERAYGDALDMLESARLPRSALFLILD